VANKTCTDAGHVTEMRLAYKTIAWLKRPPQGWDVYFILQKRVTHKSWN
jgi:hypothetical protein